VDVANARVVQTLVQPRKFAGSDPTEPEGYPSVRPEGLPIPAALDPEHSLSSMGRDPCPSCREAVAQLFERLACVRLT
jgi:hypothetical protein